MGNNAAYSAIESIAIQLYDKDKLDLVTLDILCNEWRDCDVDSGGSRGLRTQKDKLSLEELIVKLVEPEWFDSHVKPKGTYKRKAKEWDAYMEALSDEEYRITRTRWKWW